MRTGTVRLTSDPLGGTTLELVQPDGSFWYYAHLEGYAAGIDDGSLVRRGTIIGRCGSTGDASVPHLHICRFTPNGTAVDPMPSLVRALRIAERRTGATTIDDDRAPSTVATASAENAAPLPDRREDLGTTEGLPIAITPPRAPASSSGDPTLLIEAALIPCVIAIRLIRRSRMWRWR